ncbi:MAG TPA: hypothetical protein VNW46_14590 [Gemmatimonadaceae bacterium]|nr:hypothetical protein [Gemmatimonadaceae bacterium]
MAESGHHWRFNAVTGLTSGDESRLTHDVGGELWVRRDRLVRGAGYDTALRQSRRELARTGAILRLRRRGRYHVHASGVVSPAGRAWIFTGVTGSGKSTMAYALARRGWRVLGDDGVIVEPHAGDGGVTAYAWRDTMLVSALLRAEFPELGDDADARAIPGDLRRRVPAPHVGVAHSGPVAAVICLDQGAPDSLTPIPAVEALVELVRQSAWVLIPDPAARLHLEGLRALVTRVPTFRLTHSPHQLQAIEATLGQAGI